jgi:hypothetical protein
MLLVPEHSTLEEASGHLMPFVLRPGNWVAGERRGTVPVQRAEYQRRVGKLRVCAAVEVGDALEVHLRIAFRAPGLTPTRAADYLEAFLRGRLPLLPNTEWEVEIDEQHWIHFRRTYLGKRLVA